MRARRRRAARRPMERAARASRRASSPRASGSPQPIGLAEPDARGAAVPRAHDVHVDAPVARATLFWTALGVAEPELNGAAVSDDVLSPGLDELSRPPRARDRRCHRARAQGENVIGATVAGAWYTEKYGFFTSPTASTATSRRSSRSCGWSSRTGPVRTIATGDGWRADGDGPVVASGIYAGEHQDLRRPTRLVDARRTTTPLGARARRRRGQARLRERAGARGADRAARAPRSRRCRSPRCSPRPPAA